MIGLLAQYRVESDLGTGEERDGFSVAFAINNLRGREQVRPDRRSGYTG